MKKLKFSKLGIHILSMFILVMLCSSCSIDDITDEILGGGKVTATINGNKFESVAETDWVEITSVPGYYTIILAAGDVQNLKKGKALAFATIGEEYSTLKVGTTWNKVGTGSEINTAEAGYEENTSDDTNEIDTEFTEDIYVKITSIDKDKKIISGEFSFTVVDEDTGKKFKVTNGKFMEITYKLTEL